MADFKKIMTPEFRVSYPELFTPKSFSPEQEPKFSVQMLFPKESKAELAGMMNLVKEVIAEKWPGKDEAFLAKLRKPWKDGDTDRENKPEYEGMIFCNATSRQDRKPVVVDENADQIIDQSEVYGGCWCRATITCYAYDKAGNRGVAFGLQGIQKIRDDDRFGGGGGSAADFSPVGAAGSKSDEEAMDDMFS